MWNKDVFGLIQNIVVTAITILQDLETQAGTDPNLLMEVANAKSNFDKELEREELFQRNKARESSLKFGDKNSKYISACIKDKVRNKSFRIKTSDGRYIEDMEEILKEDVLHFNQRFSASPSIEGDDFLNHVCQCLSAMENESLTCVMTMKELEECPHTMNYDSALGPDGFGGMFFVKAWEIVKDDVFAAITGFFKVQTSLEDLQVQTSLISQR